MAHEIRIPRLGWSMEEGVFVGWLKQPGEKVSIGEALFELESDKALQQIESLDAGMLFVPPNAPEPGATVAVGALLGFLLAANESPPTVGSSLSPSDASLASTTLKAQAALGDGAAGPAVRRLARELQVDLATVAGTGKRGRITCEDVEATSRSDRSKEKIGYEPASDAVASPRARRAAAELGVEWRLLRGTGRGGRVRESDVRCAVGIAPAKSVVSRGVPLSPRRKVIADRLRKSRQLTIPVTLTTTADATHLVAWREKHRSSGGAIVPAYTDFLAAVVARVLARHERLAVRWEAGDEALVSLGPDELHISLAVDTPGGMLTPVLRGIASKSVLELASESRRLVDRARLGRLTDAEMQGGAITITNLGSYGIDAFTPVINYPEISILGVGAIRLVPVVTSDGLIVPQHRITLSLTFDHAAVDGAPAATFLQDVATSLGGDLSGGDHFDHFGGDRGE
jgi:pyruvate dehydrogenase E2 component (dihydrolipoamide acetyltransferase)